MTLFDDESNKYIYCKWQNQKRTRISNAEQQTYLTFIYVNKLTAEGHVSRPLWRHHTRKTDTSRCGENPTVCATFCQSHFCAPVRTNTSKNKFALQTEVQINYNSNKFLSHKQISKLLTQFYRENTFFQILVNVPTPEHRIRRSPKSTSVLS
jgi:hypothetical protein